MANCKGAKKKAREEAAQQEEMKRWLGSWDITFEQVGDFNPDEYLPMCALLKGDPTIEVMKKRVDAEFHDLQERIARRWVRVTKYARSHKVSITAEQDSKLVDQISIFYERKLKIGQTKIMVLPLMQLFARAPKIIHHVYCHDNYETIASVKETDFPDEAPFKEATRQRRNEFVSALVCEKFGATMFEVCGETDYTPALVAFVYTKDTHPDIFKKVEEYPNIEPLDEQKIRCLMAMNY